MTQIPTWRDDSPAPAPNRATPGTTIGGRYTLRTAVGHGGMGTVWRATDNLLGREVAVKEVVLPPGLAASDRNAMYERTLREARAAAALQHPAVVQVYDVITEDDRPWIVMELLQSRSLADIVLEDGPLAPRAVAKIGIALLGALEVAHAAGVLHRDVKPANVLVCSDGRCVLTDFGVARMPSDVQLTTPGMVLGSPHFISPERAMGREFGPPSDLFSLGVTLYTAVEGRPPFDKGDPIETMRAVVEEPPAPPTRAGALRDVLFGLLEKDPARRLDLVSARNMLRSLLAGPLASQAAGTTMTDPYAVVSAPQSSWQPPTPPAQSGQIGGRAMLQPGESLADRLNRSQAAQQPGGLGTPTSALPGWDGQPTSPAWAPAGAVSAPPAYGTPQPGGYGGQPGSYRAGGGQPGVYGGGRKSVGATLDKALADARSTGGRLLDTVRGWPTKIQVAAAGGLVLVVLLGTVLLSGGSDDGQQAVAQPSPTASEPPGPDFETQEYAGRGLTVNVPKNWKVNAPKGAVYVDFTDPELAGRRIRILVEKSKAQPLAFLDQAGDRLSRNTSSCAEPYEELGLRETELAERPAAELEYTCGEGDTKRHGIWRAVLHDGKAFSFYLSTPEAHFEESRGYYDELVRSFQLTDAG
ncbi:MAG TPA: serine/threonine-protein kinase [Micromonosporaceae bacterium]